jgi:DNA gyrase subunit A
MSNESNETEEIPSSPAVSGLSYSGDTEVSIVREMETCYLDYAMSVIVSRALPDARDGMKPVHRRILYTMHDGGARPGTKYRKSARIVGDAMGKYHPHGDSSIYDAMVRMAQDFSMRYTLVDGQGNFGSMDGDSAAAMRYTEARMDKIAEYMLSDIDKETIDWKPNYDASTEEPSVLPARIPNLLLNGSVGIAVGMATNIPPHNLGELIDALLYILKHDNPEAIETEDLMEFVKGPDFPTGGIIYNKKDILNAYATGRGSVVLRGRAEIGDVKSGRQAIIISEIPYQLNKSNFVIKIAELVQNKVIVGIHDIRDESNKESVRVVIELKKDAFPKKILNQLYKLTPLQTSFAFNMIALGDRGTQPRLFNLKELLLEFIGHRREVIERRTRYDLRIAEERAHILEGLKIALDNIDEVIATIRAANTREDAKNDLMMKFGLSERQTMAILEMQLQRLAGLERQKIEDELVEKLALIADLKDILAKPSRITTIVGEELTEIRDKFGDARKTEVHAGIIGEFDPRDTIPNESIVVSLSKQSYVKRIKSSAYRTQRRGGMGVTTNMKEEDEAHILLSTRNHNDLLFFTNTGRAFRLRAYEIPETQRTAKGQPIVNLLSLQPGETVTAILDATATDGTNLVLVSKKAVVKRLERADIENIRASGLIVMKPREDDELQWVRMTSGTDNLLLVSAEGKAIQFNEDDVRVMGRAAAGVRGMKIKDSDHLVAADIVTDTHAYVLSVSELGYGKISPVDEYREQGRGGMGIKIGATSDKTGHIIFAALLTEEQKSKGEVLLISKGGQTIRLTLGSIRKTSRVTQGVILAKLKAKGDVLVSAAVIGEGEPEADEAPETADGE